MKMTSAFANKMIRKLKEDKEFYLNKEREGYTYVASLDETPVIPDYDYSEVAAKLDEIDLQIMKIKHALNVVNATNRVTVGETEYTIDEILVRMAQLSARKITLDDMRKQQPKSRINSGPYSVKKAVPEYQYINYDLDLIKKEYEKIDSQIALMQLALDRFNQTFEFEVE
jgi:hypothetical protein